MPQQYGIRTSRLYSTTANNQFLVSDSNTSWRILLHWIISTTWHGDLSKLSHLLDINFTLLSLSKHNFPGYTMYKKRKANNIAQLRCRIQEPPAFVLPPVQLSSAALSPKVMIIVCHLLDGPSYRSPRDLSWLMCSAGSGGGHQSVRSPSTSSTTYSWKAQNLNCSSTTIHNWQMNNWWYLG
jgi:hypothetical protein